MTTTLVRVDETLLSDLEDMSIGERGKLVFTDNQDPEMGLPALPDASVALTFTSPPYWNYVDYDGHQGVGYEETYEKYMDAIESVLRIINVKTRQGGRLVVNASNMKSRLSVEGASFVYPLVPDIITRAKRAGFTFFDEINLAEGLG